MIKLIKTLSTIVVLFVFILAFNNSYADTNKKTAEYTIIIYLNGCDLENGIDLTTGEYNKEATNALNAIISTHFNDSKINIIAVTGGTNKWVLPSPRISTAHCQAWRIYGEREASMELLGNTDPSMKMMDKNTLTAYVQNIIKDFPAKKYVLIFWDHGAGPIGGYGSDQLDDGKSLSISDIADALKTALKGEKIDMVIFACCLMGNFETAYKLKDYANYMIGSEEIEYGDAFEKTLKSLNENPSMHPTQFGKYFIDWNFENYDGRPYTYSLIDLSKIGDIRSNWDLMIQKIEEQMKTKGKKGADAYRNLAIARAFSESYNEQDRASHGTTDMYDLADLISEKCKIDTTSLKKSIKDTVVYNKKCNYRPYSNGLSIFFVDKKLDKNLSLNDNLQKYAPSCFSKHYYDFITSYYNKLFIQNPTNLIGDIALANKYIIDLNPKSYPPHYFIKVDQQDIELVNQIYFLIGKFEGKGKNRYFVPLSIDPDIDFDLESGDITLAVTGKQYCIGGEPVPIYWDNDVNKGKNNGTNFDYKPLGYFAVKYKGNTVFLVVKENSNEKDPTKSNAQIIGIWDSKEDNGKVIPHLSWLGTPPKRGDKINLLYNMGGKYMPGPEVTLDSLTISKSCLPNGEYSGIFYLEDVVGRKVWSAYKSFNIKSSLEIKDSQSAENDEDNMPDEANLDYIF
ncbi:MAG TPA: hypothetical protein DD381_11650 [Lentisphaeria bacterium]|nr:MAG: hypothetical protein A2X47_08970 [Lentisphaerae bacterium GWF2_38_69]HBM16982.1 hypothetical protein [Lentisphaeria bacterium]